MEKAYGYDPDPDPGWRSYEKKNLRDKKRRMAVKRGTRKRRAFKKGVRRGRATRKVAVSRGVRTGLPLQMLIKHKYAEYATMTSTTGVIVNKSMACNGMYDPNVSGGGHQPYYFDTMTALYNHFTVIGSRIVVKIAPDGANEVATVACLHINDDSTITPTDSATLMEMGSTSSVLIPYGTNNTTVLTKNWSLKKAFGKSGSLANSLLRGSASANPTEMQTFVISCQAADYTSTSVLMVSIEIEYIAVWNELKDIAGS